MAATTAEKTGNDTLSVAICGIRGIPACYGGFETFAEELSARLVQRGFDVTVYGRSHVINYQEPLYRGVHIVLLPAPRHKYLETPWHSLRCFLHLVRHRVDAVLVCNAANSPFLWILRLFGIPCAVNVDGIERRRAKWNWLGRMWYRLGEICSVWFATRVVSDADLIRDYYRQTYGADSVVIRYGYKEAFLGLVDQKVTTGVAGECARECRQVLDGLGLTAGDYLLYVSRLEPENNAHVVIDAYKSLPEELQRRYPLVIVGDAPYASAYIQSLRDRASKGVIFAGYQFGEAYQLLQLGARAYVQATEVGGTHPALVESMGFGNCVIANDTPENREVLGEAGLFYHKNDSASLAGILNRVMSDDAETQILRRAARDRARSCFSWEAVTADYAALFKELAGVK